MPDLRDEKITTVLWGGNFAVDARQASEAASSCIITISIIMALMSIIMHHNASSSCP
jgi:hypothetical protein